MIYTVIKQSHSETRSYKYNSVTVTVGAEATIEAGENKDTAFDEMKEYVQQRAISDADEAHADLIKWLDAPVSAEEAR